MNPLIELKEFGQSIWFDNIRRSLVVSGELARMTGEYGVTGLTSNPTIFEKAISGGAEYDEEIKRFVAEGLDEAAILERLVIDDITSAAAVLSDIYHKSGARDGYVSIEVNPELARNREATIAEALRIRGLIKAPNVMIKVPATLEGIGAVEELLYRGLNINVTLLFSVDRYEEIARAYIRALQRRAAEGLPLEGIFSVASFFVSRVDTLVDGIIDEKLDGLPAEERKKLAAFKGRTAVANAKMAYMKYREIFEDGPFRALEERGAGPQKLLWASTSTKNPLYRDVKYVEELIENGTINTMPLKTLMAFADHGIVRPTLSKGLEEARALIEALPGAGIDYGRVTSTLEEEGVKSFSDSYRALLKCIRGKKEVILAGKKMARDFQLSPLYAERVEAAIKELEEGRFMERLLEKDSTLWKEDPGVAASIKGALGWLALPDEMAAAKDEVLHFASEIKAEGFSLAVLFGMGGSSLAPLVLSSTFGPGPGWPGLIVLDSTDPGAVAFVRKKVHEAGPEKSLFIVSSKSGTTIEPLSFFYYFYDLLHAEMGDEAGRNFIAITDPGTNLETLAGEYRFRRLFTTPVDVGGRFSALSFFGLVPSAVSGIDISKILGSALAVSVADEACVPLSERPGIKLGAVLGELALAGRDKVIFSISERISTFGLWIEQLLAESTGKEGRGLVPITGEALPEPTACGPDRVFVRISVGPEDPEVEKRLEALAASGHPVIRFQITEPHDLGGEFFRWEMATAVAGHILGINPFDQPDVEAAKTLARARLRAPAPAPPGRVFEEDGISVYVGASALGEMEAHEGAGDALKGFLSLKKEGDYAALLAYYNPFDSEVETILRGLQRTLAPSLNIPVQFGYGPRYLHSTGQLHKGGPASGLFIILAHEAPKDESVPRQNYTFSKLELSQAFGDMEALDAKKRRVLLIRAKDAGLLKKVTEFILSALS